VYCAMVESADDSFGQLLKALDKDGLADRTVVIFFSDNGGLRFEGSRRKPVTDNSPLRAGKGMFTKVESANRFSSAGPASRARVRR
jgi:arylsulfatase A